MLEKVKAAAVGACTKVSDAASTTWVTTSKIAKTVFNGAKAVVTWPFSTAKSLCGKAISILGTGATMALSPIASRMRGPFPSSL